MATPEQWQKMERWHEDGTTNFASCILELRDRLAALEARQQQPEPAQRTEPEVERRPLCDLMARAYARYEHGWWKDGYAAEIDAVAEWLEQRGHRLAAAALRDEARRARGEA